ncbi:MAG: UvrD-helicase domain-containing protein [Wenzhouxiangellaceae bacterium]|nr:UvrD-helicase domain-containing protein [Wenzhouxiangellaceae bacterium]
MSDLQQRLAAVEPQRSVIVQAPAGSGKTTLLVERFLALLGVVEEPEEILAITFTRKAAAEMRERVLRFLEPGFATDAPHEQAALEKARAVAEKVQRWKLAANPQRLMIRTIDSFSHYLARSMPVASRLGPVPQPADNTRALYRRAARRTLEALEGDELSADLEQLLLWRDHRTQDIEDLLISLLARREQWLRALGVTGQPDRRAFERVLETVVTEALTQTRHALDAALASIHSNGDELVHLLCFAADTLRGQGRASDICNFAGDYDGACDSACDSKRSELPTPDSGDLPQWKAVAEALLTKAGSWRKSVTITTGFPPKTAQKARFGELLASLAGNPALAEMLQRARSLPEPRYDDQQWRTLEALIKVLERAAGELELLFAEAGQTDFTGLSRAALQGLGDEDSGFTDLGLYLDNRISHILVDEYQDTNWAQFYLLEKLTHGWQRGDGRTLFVVGDPMQSIYRFREAEVGLFMRSRDQGLNGLALDSLKLAQNFRSRSEIVDWVNDTLGPAFPTTEDIAAGAVAYARSEAGRGAGGQVETLARADEGHEAEAIAERIEQALAGHADDPDYKAAIIVRARSHLTEILPALKARGIPFRALKLDPLLLRPVVQDLLALARAIRFPADRTALLAVLRAPICGLTLADLHALAGDGADPFDDQAPGRLSDAARPRAARVFDALADARALVGRRSLRDRVEGAWHRLGGPHCLQRPTSELPEAAMFLDALASAEQQNLADDWNDFDELLQQQYTEGDPPDASIKLEILTMHGAKGLEWDLVVLPGLNRGSGGNDRELLYWLPFTPAHGHEQVLLAPLRAAWQPDNSPLIELIRSEQKARDKFENQRLLYVAATRARQQLIVCGVLDPARDEIKPAGGSLLEILWPRAGGGFIESLNAATETRTDVSAIAGQATEPSLDQSLMRVPAGWQPPIDTPLAWAPKLAPAEREIEIEFNWAGVQARRTGTVLHQLLERVGNIGIENLDPDQQRRLTARIPQLLRALGTGPGLLDKTASMIAEAFENTLASSTGRWILSGRHHDAACELALTGTVDGKLVNAVIDRTFVDEHGTRWIIDYKSGFHAGGNLEGFLAEEGERYETQLGLYRKLFELMGETDLKTALYLPRHDQLRIV